MSYVRRDRISVHIRSPLKFAHIDVAGAHVFLLNVLPGPVDVHAVGGHGGASGRDACAYELVIHVYFRPLLEGRFAI